MKVVDDADMMIIRRQRASDTAIIIFAENENISITSILKGLNLFTVSCRNSWSVLTTSAIKFRKWSLKTGSA